MVEASAADWYPAGTGPESIENRSARSHLEEPEDFTLKVSEYDTALAALQTATASGDFDAITAAACATGSTCGACHISTARRLNAMAGCAFGYGIGAYAFSLDACPMIAAMWWTAEQGYMQWHKWLGACLIGVLVYRMVWVFLAREQPAYTHSSLTALS